MLQKFRFAIPLLLATLTLPGVVHAAPTAYGVSGKLNETPPGLSNPSIRGNFTFDSGSSTPLQHITVVVGNLAFTDVAQVNNFGGIYEVQLTTPRTLSDVLWLLYYPAIQKGYIYVFTKNSSASGSALITPR